MRSLALAAVASVSMMALATVARAADMAPAPSAYDWSGFYIGLNAGAAWNNSELDGSLNCTDTDPGGFDWCGILVDQYGSDYSQRIEDNDAVFTGGAMIGANWQRESLVLGLEADVNYAGFDAGESRESDAFGSGGTGNTKDYFVTHSDLEANWWGTVRGRLGFAADNWLFYGTGGMAWGTIDASTQLDYCTDNTVACIQGWTASGSESKTKIGWTAGAGVEYGWNQWTIGAEYLYVDLGEVDFDQSVEEVGKFFPSADGTISGDASVDYQFSVARATLKWKF